MESQTLTDFFVTPGGSEQAHATEASQAEMTPAATEVGDGATLLEVSAASSGRRKRGRPPRDRSAFDDHVACMERGEVARIPFCTIDRGAALYVVGIRV